MEGVVGIITGRERRRRWSLEQKLGIVAETYESGVRDVAARHDLGESAVFTWRRQARWTSPEKVGSDLLNSGRRLAHDGNKDTRPCPACRDHGLIQG